MRPELFAALPDAIQEYIMEMVNPIADVIQRYMLRLYNSRQHALPYPYVPTQYQHNITRSNWSYPWYGPAFWLITSISYSDYVMTCDINHININHQGLRGGAPYYAWLVGLKAMTCAWTLWQITWLRCQMNSSIELWRWLILITSSQGYRALCVEICDVPDFQLHVKLQTRELA